MEEIAKIRRPRNTTSHLPGQQLSRAFFVRSPEVVAPLLLGKLLAHANGREVLAGRIVEVEAYLGPHNDPQDPAAHAYRGPTPRNAVLFGPAGHAYVYSIYGRYFCMNISCEAEGLAGCVLIRALEPLAGIERMASNRSLESGAPPRLIASGPSRLCQAMGITRSDHNGLDLTSANSLLQVRDDGFSANEIVVTARIGITAKEAINMPLRFALRGHGCVSGPKGLAILRNLRM